MWGTKNTFCKNNNLPVQSSFSKNIYTIIDSHNEELNILQYIMQIEGNMSEFSSLISRVETYAIFLFENVDFLTYDTIYILRLVYSTFLA